MFSFVFIILLGIVFAGHLENGTLHSSRKSNIYGIMGGRIVDIEEYPYQVSFQFRKRHMCGGSIISEKYILTAAHCISGQWKNKIKQYQIRYGSNYRDRGGETVDIKSMVRHPKYNSEDYDYDIGIVELSKCLVFDAKCQSVRLPEGSQVIVDGTFLTVSGYGVIGGVYGDDVDETLLRAVKVRKVSYELCEEHYFQRNIEITPRMICAGYENAGKDACSGDSGGPLVIGDTQVGIVAFGGTCKAGRQIPGVYIRVAPLRCWIRENTGV